MKTARMTKVLFASALSLASAAAWAAQHDDGEGGMMEGDGGMMDQGGMMDHGGMMGQGGMSGMGGMDGMSPDAMLGMMMSMMDTDDDGTLSLEEVQTVHARMFERVDTDDDGQVTTEEMKGFMQRGGPSASEEQ